MKNLFSMDGKVVYVIIVPGVINFTRRKKKWKI